MKPWHYGLQRIYKVYTELLANYKKSKFAEILLQLINICGNNAEKTKGRVIFETRIYTIGCRT